MLSKNILDKIESGEIKSRRQLYRKVGRSKKLLNWLNNNNILIPNKWDKGRVKSELLKLERNLGRIPRANDDPNLTARAQKYYGKWNFALNEVFGNVNQRRYDHISDNELLDTIMKYIKKYQKLPLREEFDGSSDKRPYWEVYCNRFNVSKWSDIFGLLDLSNIKIFPNNHGYGQVNIIEGIVFLSRQECLIGKYLIKNKINFEKEVPYGNSNHIFDFYLPDFDTYIEYYGISTEDYINRINEKRKFYSGRKVIEIFKHDNTISKLDSEVQRL